MLTERGHSDAMGEDRLSAWGEVRRQTCKACHRPDKFDFTVSDEVWRAVVPLELQTKVVCLNCFDDFAREAQVDYSNAIQLVYFAGDQACFQFTRAWGNRT